jgi:hypothetical protein
LDNASHRNGQSLPNNLKISSLFISGLEEFNYNRLSIVTEPAPPSKVNKKYPLPEAIWHSGSFVPSSRLGHDRVRLACGGVVSLCKVLFALRVFAERIVYHDPSPIFCFVDQAKIKLVGWGVSHQLKAHVSIGLCPFIFLVHTVVVLGDRAA